MWAEYEIVRLVRVLSAIREAGNPEELGGVDTVARRLLLSLGLDRAQMEDLIRAADPVRRLPLEQWCALTLGGTIHLAGLCSGHPRLHDGGIVTSPVVSVARRLSLAVTFSGSLYELGQPLPRADWPDGAIDLFAALAQAESAARTQPH